MAETLEEKPEGLASSQDPHHSVASKASHFRLLSISLPICRMGRERFLPLPAGRTMNVGGPVGYGSRDGPAGKSGHGQGATALDQGWGYREEEEEASGLTTQCRHTILLSLAYLESCSTDFFLFSTKCKSSSDTCSGLRVLMDPLFFSHFQV